MKTKKINGMGFVEIEDVSFPIEFMTDDPNHFTIKPEDIEHIIETKDKIKIKLKKPIKIF